MEYNVAVVGEVDASKSTLIGVLSSGELDDGRGSARLHVLSLKHERETGRTSNVNTVMASIKHGNDSVDIRFLDLAGHEKYINTTLKGLTSYFPNYALLLIAANRGVTKTAGEHFKACYRLNIPIIICVTKIDMTPPDVLKDTINQIKLMCKPKDKSVRIFMYDVKNDDTLERAVKGFNESPCQIVPYFQVSNVSGLGLDRLKEFLAKIRPDVIDPSIPEFMEQSDVKKLFLVYKPYYVNGIGYVVFGKNCGAPISQRDKLLIGPINNKYQEFTVRSIHNSKREPVTVMDTGGSGCLAMSFTKFHPSKKILKGTVVIDTPIYVTRIVAEVIICEHSTTVKLGYKPFINCGSASLSGKVVGLYKKNPYPKNSLVFDPTVEKLDAMRIEDRGFIEFVLPKAQFIFIDNTIIFRDGGLRGIGVITSTFSE